ncbi:Predicted dehydrogenase [Parafrankia irregularis]|uniref:Predicted dehydrogenase n=1 Tax=Parafrankia irregularis TaxID=795642 RepID=A0A0S4QTQ8_9ACTN|nr:MULTISPECIES: Gfo/Idh/MocA family oxidoreductase [Parafrankia]MBE3205013.1 Gfo/Idh/MocA family oxidoreductase [Parafrankia sp. CH37]CUU58511.1 Predicted dehydrogenase [Parafrankia irregularis]
MQPLGVAVIGAGYWGPNLVRNFASSGSWRLRWVCDFDTDRARAVAGHLGDVRVTADLGEVLSDPEVAAVAIATPAASHTELTLAAIDAGRHVLVEKPLAATAADGAKLVAAAQAAGVVLMCDHTYCYTPSVMRIRELTHSGEIGDIQYIDSVRINLGLIQPDVDVFWDLAPHDLSILDFVLPAEFAPLSVTALGADPVNAGRSCVGYLTMPLRGGGIAHIHVNWLSPTKIRKTVVGGSRKMIVWDDLEPSQRLSIYDKGVEISERPLDDRARRLVSYRVGDMVAPALAETEALRGVVTEFADAIREGRPARTDGSSGLRVLRMLEAAAESAAKGGQAVPLPTEGKGLPA